jgi:hypothetical protein
MGIRMKKTQRRLNPYFDPVTEYVEIPPASLSATIVMIPGPNTARRMMPRFRIRRNLWMLLLIQYIERIPSSPYRVGGRKSADYTVLGFRKQ